ncbi:MmoB/DmpM family protein [Streptomyces sp. Agncl-13]|uniref:MmoB/DmpM family protein n=1 Tax=Streptomyces sp. Agncl-13 TaxID=3400628 RepID=UPI003A8AFE12
MTVYELDSDAPLDPVLVGPVLRSGPLADAVIEAVSDDNPDRDVYVVDRDDYVRVHTMHECRLTRRSLEEHLGGTFQLSALEIEMPSFKGRMRSRSQEYLWFHSE